MKTILKIFALPFALMGEILFILSGVFLGVAWFISKETKQIIDKALNDTFYNKK